jgi:hypothetical protein
MAIIAMNSFFTFFVEKESDIFSDQPERGWSTRMAGEANARR